MNIDEALNYFMQAEKNGYHSPDANTLSVMDEKDIIKLATYLGERGDDLANQ